MDETKHPKQPETENPHEALQEPAPDAAGARKWLNRRLFSKRWVYPAVYLGAAAVIIGLMYIKTQMGTPPSTEQAPGPAQPTVTTAEEFIWPVAPGVTPVVSMGFFPVNGNAQQQAHALVLYDHGWYPHEGLDIKSQDGAAFTVVAAADGKVTRVEGDKLYGQTVEVTSADGYVERYQSLGKVNVKAGDTVAQGQPIGTSGSNRFEAAQGNHLYFAVLKDGEPVDPSTLLPKP
ncbi:hypothetical protein GCM10010885_20420 [Alicyclobacillus cellulosilyticus]|uniref:M23ase beta-sheet core domain-containing protein n=1 Tax=Alicyclobacillus cellulosilyticus TaxID=1003997 RepID=A0A917KEC0_9BACL|nr:M23 family metallopeptidase [Alicyclobacillus cellulosilyticus]GGJ11068.1 hypothetical protein GCM10010885_20420 [Alicyclobacillus cellulosilyticus]